MHSAKHRSLHGTCPARSGFSLIELLVAVGIIAVLAGILIPVVSGVRRRAAVTAQKMDFQAIAAALEAYRNDFTDYPRPPLRPNSDPTPADPGLLVAAILAPGPAVGIGADGADGLGFRAQTGAGGGKVWGPYLSPEKVTLRGPDPAQLAAGRYVVRIEDRWGTPVRYYAKNPGAASAARELVGRATAVWDSRHGGDAALSNEAMQIMLGDDNLDNQIRGDERLRHSGPFMLWSAGPDEKWGPAREEPTGKVSARTADLCDDVLNFER